MGKSNCSKVVKNPAWGFRVHFYWKIVTWPLSSHVWVHSKYKMTFKMGRLTFSYHSCKNIYRMARNFRGTKVSLIGCWQRFSQKNFSRFDDRKATPTLGVANHTHTTRESAVMASEFSVWCVDTTFMRYIWDATVSEEQPSQRESDIINRQRHRGTAWHSPPSPTDSSALPY